MVRVVALCVVLWQSWAAFALDEHKREQEKHAAPTQYLVPSIWDSIKVAANLTVWGLGYAGTVVEVAKEWGGLGDLCPYSSDPANAAAVALSDRIKAQPLARQTIVGAMEAWEFDHAAGKSAPLVLAITGPTGVGKTETAWVLAESILLGRTKHTYGGISSSAKGSASPYPDAPGSGPLPRGLIFFRGEDFSDANEPIHEYRTRIKTTLVDKLRECSGRAVVLFDEVQKVVPGTLDVLMEAMGEHPVLTYYSHGRAVTVDCSRVIFILISDIGTDAILEVLLNYKTREEVPLGRLRTAVKKALDRQWDELRFGKVVDRVIPYLPMGPREVLQVMELKLSNLARDFSGRYFMDLYASPDLQWHLCSRAYINYGNYSSPESLSRGISHLFAVYGARNIDNDGPMRLIKAKMMRYMQPWRPSEVVDLRYDQSDRTVAFRWCPQDYAEGLSQEERGQPDAVARCEMAWSGPLHDHAVHPTENGQPALADSNAQLQVE